jgi:hypothetical protein
MRGGSGPGQRGTLVEAPAVLGTDHFSPQRQIHRPVLLGRLMLADLVLTFEVGGL